MFYLFLLYINYMTFDRKLFKLIQNSDRITVERILNSSPDKEIAVSVLYFSDSERGILFSYLAPGKRDRVQEEIRRSPEIKYSSYKMIIEKLIKSLESGKQNHSGGGYFRPSGR